MGKKQERRIVVAQPRRSSLSNGGIPQSGYPPVPIRAGREFAKNTPISKVILDQLVVSEQQCEDEQAKKESGDSEAAIIEVDANSSTLCRSPKKWGYKNVYGLSLAFVFLFSAFNGLQNLQSSINNEGGLGIVSLSLLYSTFIFSGFVTPGFIKLLGTKNSLLFGFICFLVYTLTNYYPSWYTLIPSSVIVGFASAPIWAAASSHITEIAIRIASPLHKQEHLLISRFMGIFFFTFQFSQVPGNLASSLILFPYGDESSSNTSDNITNASMLEANSEQCDYLETTTLNPKYLYILVSVYAMFIVTGIVILILTVDDLPPDNIFLSSKKKYYLYLQEPFLELLQVLTDWKMVLIAPMAVFNGMEMAFAFGSFTETYISECFGTHQVGFTLICLGISSAIMSMVYGRMVKYVPRFAIVLFGSSLNLIFIVTLLVWQRVPSYAVIFTFAVGWGAADAVWNTMSTSLTGILFAERSETAFSALRIWLATGFTVGFASAKIITVEGRLWMLLGTLVVAAVCNLIVEFRSQSKQQLLPCVYLPSKKGQNSDENDEDASEPESYEHEPSVTQSPSHTNALFAAYSGKRPSDWSVMSESPPPAYSQGTTLGTIVEIMDETETGQFGRKNSINPSPSYYFAIVAENLAHGIAGKKSSV